MKKTTHGFIIADRGVIGPYIKATQNCGWNVKKAPKSIRDTVSDEYIARTFGRGKILLTYDKTAYKHNTPQGFIGYVVYEQDVPKSEFGEYLGNYTNMMTELRIGDIDTYIVSLKRGNKKYVKEKLPPIQEASKKNKD